MDPGFVDGYRRKRFQAYDAVNGWFEKHETWAAWAGALALALVTGALAQVKLYTSLTPIPFTGQVLGVAFMGGLLGRKWGTLSALLYVALGIVGIPIYADGGHGIDVFRHGLSAGYILGFIPQAYVIGWVADRRSQHSASGLIAFGSLAGVGLLAFSVLDIFFLADYTTLFGKDHGAFRTPWFLLMAAALVVIVAGCAWLAFTTRARRERIELFMGGIVGSVVLYVVGVAWLWAMWNTAYYQAQNYGPLDLKGALRLGVLPFIAVDFTKLLLAVGVLTLVRPTRAEIDAAQALTGGRTDV